MDDPLATQSQLLVRLRQSGDQDAWREFVARYAPIVYRYARQQGLQDADAADVTQEVLKAVALAMRDFHYDRQRGRFRSWLYAVTRNHLSKFWRATAKALPVVDTFHDRPDALSSLPQDDDFDLWDAECDNELFRLAARQVRADAHESTWNAFWKTAVLGADPKTTAEELGMSVGAVYIAKSRVIARLKQRIDELRQEESDKNLTQS